MTQTNKQIKVAVLDLYNGIPNEGMRSFEELLQRYKTKNNSNFTYQIFDVRKKEELPGIEFDIYISSGGPGSPLTENEEWDKKYIQLIDQLEGHNRSDDPQKKIWFFRLSFLPATMP